MDIYSYLTTGENVTSMENNQCKNKAPDRLSNGPWDETVLSPSVSMVTNDAQYRVAEIFLFYPLTHSQWDKLRLSSSHVRKGRHLGYSHLASCVINVRISRVSHMSKSCRRRARRHSRGVGSSGWDRTSISSHGLNSQEGVSVNPARVDWLFSVEIKMSEVIASKMPPPDENHQFRLMVWCLGLLMTGAHFLYECPSGTTQVSSAESPLMVKINGCKLSNRAISGFFSFLRRNLPMTDLTMATVVNEWHDCPVAKPTLSNCETRCWQLPEKGTVWPT